MHTQVATGTLIECGVDNEPAKEISRQLFAEFTQPQCWEVFPEVWQVLGEIKRQGLKVGVVSNFDQRLGIICMVLVSYLNPRILIDLT